MKHSVWMVRSEKLPTGRKVQSRSRTVCRNSAATTREKVNDAFPHLG